MKQLFSMAALGALLALPVCAQLPKPGGGSVGQPGISVSSLQRTTCIRPQTESSEGDDDYVVAYDPAITGDYVGLCVLFRPDVANTGAATLDAGLGPEPIKMDDDTNPIDGVLLAEIDVMLAWSPTLNSGNGAWSVVAGGSVVNSTTVEQVTNNVTNIQYNQPIIDRGKCKNCSAATPFTSLLLDSYATVSASTCDAERAGQMGMPSDSPYRLVCNGTLWEHYLDGWGKVTPPVLGEFTGANLGSTTAVTTYGGVYLSGPSNGGSNSLRYYYKAAPSTPYSITAILFPRVAGNDQYWFIGWRQSSDGKLITNSWLVTSSGSFDRRVLKWTNATTFSADYVSSVAVRVPSHHGLGLKITEDGTNRRTFICYSKHDCQQIGSNVSRTDFLTADGVIFGFDPAADAGGMHLVGWIQE